MMYRYLVYTLLFVCVYCWTDIDFEVFDAVEEVGENFYELLGVSKDASESQLKKAFRKLSLVLHPDKNPSPDADVKFRHLVTAYEILKDLDKRTKYDEVLRDGLPDWRMPIYYYRRVRKMGLAEMLVILSFIFTLGHYLMAWGAYWEKRFTLSEQIDQKKKRQEKLKKRKQIDVISNIEEESILEKPSLWNLLPFQLLRLIKFLVVSTPDGLLFCLNTFKEWREKSSQPIEEEEEPQLKEKRPKRKKVYELPDFSDGGCLLDPVEGGESLLDDNEEDEDRVGGFWSDDDFSLLIKLMKKYPGGTPERWEKIADCMFRTVYEITTMAKKVKEDGYQAVVSLETQGVTGTEAAIVMEPETLREEQVKVKERHKKSKPNIEPNAWSQKQQQALEEALKIYRKGTEGRWDKIASKVPEKSKEECMSRYMELVDRVKKKSCKEATAEE